MKASQFMCGAFWLYPYAAARHSGRGSIDTQAWGTATACVLALGANTAQAQDWSAIWKIRSMR
jgi:hypothetical protein